MRILGLRSRIFILLGILVAVNLTGALATLWYVQRIQALFAGTMEEGTEILTTAQEMQQALLSQRGFVSYFFLEGDPQWLEKLHDAEQRFETSWRHAFDLARTREDRNLLLGMETRYIRYAIHRERVVQLYKTGKQTEGQDLHAEVRKEFLEVVNLCDMYARQQTERITSLIASYQDRFAFFGWLAWSAIPAAAILGLLLAFVIMRRVLAPIQKIAGALSAHADQKSRQAVMVDEVEYLGDRIQLLLRDVDQAQDKLAKSREDLLQAEKMATIGKLAAGVAHSVRNPLTSVKMRLFTLERSLQHTPETREDLEVINEEIDFIDTILKNFLEFSRPPKLKPQPVEISSVVDQSLQLLKHRFENMRVQVSVQRDEDMPLVLGDPDQLKEVLVNILVNAMDAMGEGGKIAISEEQGVIEPYGRVVIVRITDTGPGLAPAVQSRLFEPFISTKEDGTGLGLPISKRIVEEHGGWLHVTSETGRGATFVIGLPQLEQNQ